MTSNPLKARLMMASALTKIHPGAGRSPGVVDLPVIKDPNGYPYIPGSQVKGSIKTRLAALQGGVEDGTIKCDNSVKCVCYLFGGEPGQGPEGASAVQVSDLYPLLLPAPAANDPGIVFITTPYLLSKAAALASAAGKDELSQALTNAHSRRPDTSIAVKGVLVEGAMTSAEDLLPGHLEIVCGLNPLYRGLLDQNILIVPDGHGRVLIDQLLERVTRVRLDRKTKTVSTGALWTEEYLPWGTLFVGAIFDTGFRNTYKNDCDKNDDPLALLEQLLGDTTTIVVGGKESVGAGLLRIKLA